MDGETLESQLQEHEVHSEQRAAALEGELKHLEDIAMTGTTGTATTGDGFNLGNIISQLTGGNMASTGNAGLIGLAGLLPLLTGNRGILGTGADAVVAPTAADAIFNNTVLSKLGTLEGAIPLAEGQVQNAVLQQTVALTNSLDETKEAIGAQISALGSAQAASTSMLLQAIMNSTNTISSKIDGNTIMNLQTELAESRAASRAAATEVNVTQNVNQSQAQAQTQQQFQIQNNLLNQILASHQYLQQGIVNLGTMSGSAGQQTAANTRVN